MFTRKLILGTLTLMLVSLVGGVTKSQTIVRDYNSDYYPSDVKIDRYLDVEVWTDRSDAEYYEGDDIVIYFRASRDAFVAIYSIDTRGRVNLLFPTGPGDDNYIHGGVTYAIPGDDDDYDLEVSGPEGQEHIQIIASRERFPIPNWYHNSGLVADADDMSDYMDYLNSRYFVRYGGQRFAFDRAVIFVNEWEQDYYRPVYSTYYPSWALVGNVYVDYPYGGSVYIDGIYWGVAPLYIPRLLVGWHYVTIYDSYGYCWESPFHASYYNTVVFNRTVVKTSPTVVSRYKKVRTVGYRDPVRNGYPGFKAKTVRQVTKTTRSGSRMTVNKTTRGVSGGGRVLAKKYVRGSSKLVRTERGLETAGITRGERKISTAGYKERRHSARDLSSGKRRAVVGQSKRSAGDAGGKYRSTKTSRTSRSSKVSRGSSHKAATGGAVKKGKTYRGTRGGGKAVKKGSTKSGKQGKSGSVKSRGSSGSSKSSGGIKSRSSGGRSSGSIRSGSRSSGGRSRGHAADGSRSGKSGKPRR